MGASLVMIMTKQELCSMYNIIPLNEILRSVSHHTFWHAETVTGYTYKMCDSHFIQYLGMTWKIHIR